MLSASDAAVPDFTHVALGLWHPACCKSLRFKFQSTAFSPPHSQFQWTKQNSRSLIGKLKGMGTEKIPILWFITSTMVQCFWQPVRNAAEAHHHHWPFPTGRTSSFFTDLHIEFTDFGADNQLWDTY